MRNRPTPVRGSRDDRAKGVTAIRDCVEFCCRLFWKLLRAGRGVVRECHDECARSGGSRGALLTRAFRLRRRGSTRVGPRRRERRSLTITGVRRARTCHHRARNVPECSIKHGGNRFPMPPKCSGIVQNVRECSVIGENDKTKPRLPRLPRDFARAWAFA